MDSNNFYRKENNKVCKNGCGKFIRWDTSENFYIEIDTGKRHKCPNYRPSSQRKQEYISASVTKEQAQYIDTIGPLIAETYSIVKELQDNFKKLLDNRF